MHSVLTGLHVKYVKCTFPADLLYSMKVCKFNLGSVGTCLVSIYFKSVNTNCRLTTYVLSLYPFLRALISHLIIFCPHKSSIYMMMAWYDLQSTRVEPWERWLVISWRDAVTVISSGFSLGLFCLGGSADTSTWQKLPLLAPNYYFALTYMKARLVIWCLLRFYVDVTLGKWE